MCATFFVNDENTKFMVLFSFSRLFLTVLSTSLLFPFGRMVLYISILFQAYVDAILDLASHFITRLRRYASFCRTLASHAVGASAGTGSTRNMVTSPPHNSSSPSTNQGQYLIIHLKWNPAKWHAASKPTVQCLLLHYSG